MASLTSLPPEVQKTLINSLDYQSLCILRSTNRYFYNFLTEPEIQEVFLNMEIPKGDTTKKPREGGVCVHCCTYCDATEAQLQLKAEKEVEDREEITRTENLRKAATRGLYEARDKANKARASLRRVKEKLKAERQVRVDEAETKVAGAKENLSAATKAADDARRNRWSGSNPDIAKKCHSCNRMYNGYQKPGILDLSLPRPNVPWGMRNSITLVCTRTSHYSGRLLWDDNYQKMQRDAKICKICWKGTSRGTSGKQRRMVFAKEYGYWMRETWLGEVKAIKDKTKVLAKMTLEDIEEKEMLITIKEEESADENADEPVSEISGQRARRQSIAEIR
jgi:hypothetical protein